VAGRQVVLVGLDFLPPTVRAHFEDFKNELSIHIETPFVSQDAKSVFSESFHWNATRLTSSFAAFMTRLPTSRSS